MQCVSGTAKVYFKKDGIKVSDEKLSILAEQIEARCPVANMMYASGCDMDIKWINGSTSSEEEEWKQRGLYISICNYQIKRQEKIHLGVVYTVKVNVSCIS